VVHPVEAKKREAQGLAGSKDDRAIDGGPEVVPGQESPDEPEDPYRRRSVPKVIPWPGADLAEAQARERVHEPA
jgi:hypothetical protein